MHAGLCFFLVALGLAMVIVAPAVAEVVREWRASRNARNVRFDHRLVGVRRRYRP